MPTDSTREWLKIAAIAFLLFHAVGLVSWVTYRVFGPNPPEISGGTATALAAVYGLPALSYGLSRVRKYVGSAR
ncbi:hypothetical protein [Spiribacter onubensis]|uniref:Uncharacterized protein n=1 Tax=Spiribacter onubensis TaxID=3122420 RepID=A0ABV3S799_9GAMM